MRRKGNTPKSLFSISGYLMFFALVCAVATCSILAYSAIYARSGGNIATTAIVTLVILLALALLCTVVDAMRRKFTVERPVQNIVDATERITSGDYSTVLVPSHSYMRYNEMDIIMENINHMTGELAKKELLAADFVSNVSHEIKTPLAVIEYYAVALGKDTITDAQRTEYSLTLMSAARRLSELISNILKLSKLESQEIFPNKVAIELGEQLREAVIGLEEKIDSKSIEIDCDIDDVTIVSDGGLLEIIWNNLLSNAIKFTGSGGRVAVSLKSDGNHATVRVTDSGCGIDNATIGRIFDKFYQADSSHATEGNGLGLALVKRVIDILGGEIVVKSQPNIGSTFEIKIAIE